MENLKSAKTIEHKDKTLLIRIIYVHLRTIDKKLERPLFKKVACEIPDKFPRSFSLYFEDEMISDGCDAIIRSLESLRDNTKRDACKIVRKKDDHESVPSDQQRLKSYYENGEKYSENITKLVVANLHNVKLDLKKNTANADG